MRYAYVLTGDPHDAADLLQESLVRVRAAWHGIVNERRKATCVPRWPGCTSVSGASAGGPRGYSKVALTAAAIGGRNGRRPYAAARFTVGGQHAAADQAVRLGLHDRQPLAGGGATQEVPGSRSTHILTWPWIGSPDPGLAQQGDGVGSTAFARVKNVLTGQTLSAHLTDRAAWTWCVGRDANSVTEAQRRDGSGHRSIPPGEPGPLITTSRRRALPSG